MKQYPLKNVGAEAVNILLKKRHRIDEELSKQLMGRVYVLEDGRALLVDYDGTGLLWESHEELTKNYWASLKRALQRNDPLREILPDPHRFETNVLAIVAERPSFLDCDAQSLDFSEKSLDIIDNAIRKFGPERVTTVEVFPWLVAYVGEVIRRLVNGVWNAQDSSAKRAEPEIVDPTGGRYQPVRIYKELLEHGRSASMRAFVQGAVGTQRMLPKVLPAKNKRPT